jgi:GAF domain-containing protein
MSDSFAAALDALERSVQTPAGFCRPFLDVLPVSGASVSTVGDLLGSETLSASDELAARLDELQFDLGEGPCWDAVNSGRPVLEPDVRSLPRSTWPAFSDAILHAGISSIFAFPLAVGPLRMGAVDLYSVAPVELDRRQTKQADAMAAVVGRHVLRQALNAVGRDADDVGNAFSRRLIHQATGVVLAQLDLSADDARLVIHGHAFAASRSMKEIAQDILDGLLNFSRGDTGIEASE